MTDEKDLGAQSATADDAACSLVLTPQLSHAIPLVCWYCGEPAQGNYSIHRDGFSVGPEVPLCDAHGEGESPSLCQIWERIAERFGPPRTDYQTVMADPPWMEAGAGKTKRGADRHYPLMKTEDICALPVDQWTEPDAHLYLWVTNNFLLDGLEVMKAWRFRYVTTITWMKDRMGIGQYYRGITEHCLFGVRGKLPYQLGQRIKRTTTDRQRYGVAMAPALSTHRSNAQT